MPDQSMPDDMLDKNSVQDYDSEDTRDPWDDELEQWIMAGST
jgi:hypothetical protein